MHSEHNRAEDWTCLEQFRTRQQQRQALCSGSPKSSFGSTLNLENLECLQKKKACSNILLLLEPCLGPILETCMGRRARNHPRAHRRALATGAPDGAELLGWGWRRRQPGKRGGRAGCAQMHGAGTRTALGGKGAGIQSSLTFPLHDRLEAGGKHGSSPSHGGHAIALGAGLPLAHRWG